MRKTAARSVAAGAHDPYSGPMESIEAQNEDRESGTPSDRPTSAVGPGSRGTHAARRETTRARAFSAATELLHEMGYAGSSILAVAKRAGISRGALAKQFPIKADLYAALVEHLLDEMRETALAHVRTFPRGLSRAMARVDAIWELYKHAQAFAVIEVMLGARSDPELSERLARVGRSRYLIERELLATDFDDMGISDRRTAGLASIQMLATVRGLAIERILNRNGATLEAAFLLQRKQIEATLRALMAPT